MRVAPTFFLATLGRCLLFSANNWLLVNGQDSSCLDALVDVVAAEMDVSDASVLRTYTLCSNTYFISTELDKKTRKVPSGYHNPLYLFRPNVHVECEEYEGSECVFYGGGLQVVVLPENNTFLSNIEIRGITFAGLSGDNANVNVVAPSEVVLNNCIFKDNIAPSTVRALGVFFTSNVPSTVPSAVPSTELLSDVPSSDPTAPLRFPSITSSSTPSGAPSFSTLETSSEAPTLSAPPTADSITASTEPSLSPSALTTLVPTTTSNGPTVIGPTIKISTVGERFVAGVRISEIKKSDSVRRRRLQEEGDEGEEGEVAAEVPDLHMTIESCHFHNNTVRSISGVAALVSAVSTVDLAVKLEVIESKFDANDFSGDIDDGEFTAMVATTSGELIVERNCFTNNKVSWALIGTTVSDSEPTVRFNYAAPDNDVGIASCSGVSTFLTSDLLANVGDDMFEDCLEFVRDTCVLPEAAPQSDVPSAVPSTMDSENPSIMPSEMPSSAQPVAPTNPPSTSLRPTPTPTTPSPTTSAPVVTIQLGSDEPSKAPVVPTFAPGRNLTAAPVPNPQPSIQPTIPDDDGGSQQARGIEESDGSSGLSPGIIVVIVLGAVAVAAVVVFVALKRFG